MNAKRRGLGQGLGALLRSDDSATPAGMLHYIAIDSIIPNPHQPRQQFDPESLEELSASIREHGVLQPLVVTRSDGGYELIAGERRWRAARLAELTDVPVIIKDVTPQERLELALIENIQRADLDPLEEARAYHLLHSEFGLSHNKIGQRVGKSRSTITNALRLLRMPAALQQAVIDQRLTAGHLKQLITIDDERTQLLAMEQITEHRLSVREAEKLAQMIKQEGLTPAQARSAIQQAGAQPRAARSRSTTVRSPQPVPSADETDVVETLTRRFGTKVEMRRQGTSGYLRIEFYDDEQLNTLIDLLLHAV